MKTYLRVILVVWLAVQGGIASAEMLLQSYDPKEHDRFENDAAFIGNPYDWSGVGRVVGANIDLGWGTMISPHYFLDARHFHPANGDTLRFYKTNDPSGLFEDRIVQSGTPIGETDLWLGKLQTEVTDVATYPILKLPNDTDYEGRIIYTFGRSDTLRADPQETNVRLGRNEIESLIDQSASPPDIVSAGKALLFGFDHPSGGVGPDESFLQRYDSGGPSFIITTIDGSPAPGLVGIHWLHDDEADPKLSADTFVPEYVEQLDRAMSGEQVMTVAPEPSTLVLLLGLGVGCLVGSVWRRAPVGGASKTSRRAVGGMCGCHTRPPPGGPVGR